MRHKIPKKREFSFVIFVISKMRAEGSYELKKISVGSKRNVDSCKNDLQMFRF